MLPRPRNPRRRVRAHRFLGRYLPRICWICAGLGTSGAVGSASAGGGEARRHLVGGRVQHREQRTALLVTVLADAATTSGAASGGAGAAPARSAPVGRLRSSLSDSTAPSATGAGAGGGGAVAAARAVRSVRLHRADGTSSAGAGTAAELVLAHAQQHLEAVRRHGGAPSRAAGRRARRLDVDTPVAAPARGADCERGGVDARGVFRLGRARRRPPPAQRPAGFSASGASAYVAGVSLRSADTARAAAEIIARALSDVPPMNSASTLPRPDARRGEGPESLKI